MSVARWWLLRNEQVRHQALDLLASDQHITHQRFNQFCQVKCQCRVHVHDKNFALQFACDEPYQFFKRKNIGSSRICNQTITLLTCLNNKISHILDINGLEAILARAEKRKNREVPHYPSNIIDEDIFSAKDDSGANDSIGEAGIDQVLFQDCFSFKVREWRCFGWISDTDMHNALYTCLFRCFEENLCILYRSLKCDRAVREANPVGVVEGC